MPICLPGNLTWSGFGVDEQYQNLTENVLKDDVINSYKSGDRITYETTNHVIIQSPEGEFIYEKIPGLYIAEEFKLTHEQQINLLEFSKTIKIGKLNNYYFGGGVLNNEWLRDLAIQASKLVGEEIQPGLVYVYYIPAGIELMKLRHGELVTKPFVNFWLGDRSLWRTRKWGYEYKNGKQSIPPINSFEISSGDCIILSGSAHTYLHGFRIQKDERSKTLGMKNQGGILISIRQFR